MNLGECVEELRDNILHDRTDEFEARDEDGEPQSSSRLWTDRTLVRYIREAQSRMARQALLLRDGTTPEITQIPMVELTNEYTLHSSVIAILSVRCEGDRADLARAGHSNFATYHNPDTYFFDPSDLSQLPAGKVVAYGTDEFLSEDGDGALNNMVLRTYPKPQLPHLQMMKLRVIRLPVRKLSEKNLDAHLEIPQIHHMDMLDYAAYLALRIVDRDAGDAKRAEDFRLKFEAHCKEARDIFMRKMFTPMQWGFGRNGFTWEGEGNQW